MGVYYIGAIRYSGDDIWHHGIKGQSWGVRNGPPYPLGSGDHSAAERKAGWRSSLNSSRKQENSSKQSTNTNEESKHEHKQLTDQQKKWIKIGAAAAVTALAVGGTIYLAKSGKLNSIISVGKNAVNNGGKAVFDEVRIPSFMQDYYNDMVDQCRTSFDHLPAKYKSLNQIPKAARDYAKDYFNSVNNSSQNLIDGINHGADIMTNNMRNQNCGMCSLSVIARLKGLEVTASEIPHALPREILADCFKGGKFLQSTTKQF